MSYGAHGQIIDALFTKDDLHAQWALATSTGRDDEHALSIFKMVIDLYLTIRGFAFAKSCYINK